MFRSTTPQSRSRTSQRGLRRTKKKKKEEKKKEKVVYSDFSGILHKYGLIGSTTSYAPTLRDIKMS